MGNNGDNIASFPWKLQTATFHLQPTAKTSIYIIAPPHLTNTYPDTVMSPPETEGEAALPHSLLFPVLAATLPPGQSWDWGEGRGTDTN